MQDDPNRRSEKPRRGGSADDGRAIGNAIRQAFLTHMGEQQRQFTAGMAARPADETGESRKR